MSDIPWRDSYEAIQTRAGSIELCGWSRIELRGSDRAGLLNSLGTNRLNDLTPGQGRETFFTNAKGRIVAHGIVIAAEDSMSFVTAAPSGSELASHFDRYIVREDVQVADRSEQTVMWYLGGSQAGVRLTDLGVSVPQQLYEHVSISIEGVPVSVCRVEMAGPLGFLLIASREQASLLAQTFARARIKECVPEAFEAARIAWGWPLDGLDISSNNFPQEFGRDDRAISFTKGCYLGQETISRIDSRGHVNKQLVAVRLLDTTSVEPVTLTANGAEIGHTTSLAYSTQFHYITAMAIVRSEHAAPGTKLESNLGPAEVIRFGSST